MKFDMMAAWDDSIYLLRTNRQILIPIVGLFVFLPTLVMALWIPPMAEPTGTTPAEIMAEFSDYFLPILPHLMLFGIVSAFGNLVILRLFLGNDNIAVSGAIKAALILFIPVIIAQYMTSFLTMAGFLLLIAPGLYLTGRLSLVIAVIAGENR